MPRKCPICGNWIQSGQQSIPYKKRYAHVSCFDIEMKVLSDEKQNKLSERKKSSKKNKRINDVKIINTPKTEEECIEKKELYEYIRKLIGVSKNEAVSPRISKNIEDYIKKFNFTYKTIEKTLCWYYEIMDNKIPEDDSLLGIVPYAYKEAQNYYSQIEELETIPKEKFENSYKIRNVRINPQIKFRNIVPLDISKIGEQD